MLETDFPNNSISNLQTIYLNIREQSQKLVAFLTAEDCNAQSMPDVSPSKWHLAHTTWFFEIFILKVFKPGYRVYHQEYEYLFNSYYNQIGQQYPRPRRGLLTRPSFDDVIQYRAYVDQCMSEFIEDISPELESWVTLGLNHEQQHQELLLTDIKHVFFQNPLFPAYQRSVISIENIPIPVPLTMRTFHGGDITVGATDVQFRFDNEAPRHEIRLSHYQLSNRLISNGEYLEFIEDNAYQRPSLWLADGWAALQQYSWSHPLYWMRRDGAWFEYTLAGLSPLNVYAPVCHLSYYEADAYARWRSMRLPTEFELEHALNQTQVEKGHFVESGQLHPSYGDADQLYGDCWEWTQSPYIAYPGFKPTEGAVGEYNGKFMCNQITLKGGSCLTPRDHIRASYRNFFYPHQRWQMTGLRLAKDIDLC